MRTRWIALALSAIFIGALGGMLLAPQPAGAVSKEIIQLQQQVSQLLQGQQDLRTTVDTNNATLRTLVQQSLDGVNQLNRQMGNVQKTVQDVQANTGNSIDSMTQKATGLSDNLGELRALVVKLSQQLTDVQNNLQRIDAKVSGSSTPAPTGATGAPDGAAPGAGGSSMNSTPAAMPSISPATLYQNAMRDLNTGKSDMARQEFSDYIKNFPSDDLASNAQFYLGEIDYQQENYKDAIVAYDNVLVSYPKSFKLADSLYKKALSELALGLKVSGTRDLHDVVRRFPETDAARNAEARLRQIGSAVPRAHTTPR